MKVRKVEIPIRTVSESLSPAPGGFSLNIDDGLSTTSHGKFSFGEPATTLSFEEPRISSTSDNQNMALADAIVVETTFIN